MPGARAGCHADSTTIPGSSLRCSAHFPSCVIASASRASRTGSTWSSPNTFVRESAAAGSAAAFASGRVFTSRSVVATRWTKATSSWTRLRRSPFRRHGRSGRRIRVRQRGGPAAGGQTWPGRQDVLDSVPLPAPGGVGHPGVERPPMGIGDRGSGIGDQGSGIGDQGSGIGIPDPGSLIPRSLIRTRITERRRRGARPAAPPRRSPPCRRG